MDLKSKIDNLNTEIDSLLQSRNFDQRKSKDLEKKVLELESDLESKARMYDEIIQEF
jgi:predicted  nucleic acid-binding Zn-ribbon protein